jgi:hypothetical protein
MRDLEPFRGLLGVGVRVDRPGVRRSVDVDSMAPLKQHVEVELARPPARAGLPTSAPLDGL